MGVMALVCTFGVWCFADGSCQPPERGALTVTLVYEAGVEIAEMDFGGDPWPMLMIEPQPGIGGQTPRVFFGGDGFIQPPTMISVEERTGDGWISMHMRGGLGPGQPAMATGQCIQSEGRPG